jgi:hypothetical protein
MDDGIIEGALIKRFSKNPNIAIQRLEGSNSENDLWRYMIHHSADEP